MEHLRNLRFDWVAFGWFVAVAIASAILLALDVLGAIGVDTAMQSLWVAVVLVVSFLIGGFFVGTRVASAPIIHGIAMGIFSLVAWFLVNVFLGEPTGVTTWRSLEAGTLLGLLTLQIVASVVGARAAVRWMRSG